MIKKYLLILKKGKANNKIIKLIEKASSIKVNFSFRSIKKAIGNTTILKKKVANHEAASPILSI